LEKSQAVVVVISTVFINPDIYIYHQISIFVPYLQVNTFSKVIMGAYLPEITNNARGFAECSIENFKFIVCE